MAKKKSRKSRTSNGVIGSPERARTSVGTKRLLNQVDAWNKGKRVMLTIPNPDTTAKNARFIKVEAKQVWGLPAFMRKKEKNAS
jgi:hypothetical protein